MASTFGLLLLVAGLIPLFIGSSNAIKCYSCSQCANSVGNLISCSNEYSQCAEVRSQQLFSTSYDRYCVGQCPSYSGSAVQIKCCQTDGCNGAEAVVHSSFLAIVMAAIAVRLFA